MYYSNTAAGFEKKSGFNRIADREGFIVVYPNAVAFGPKQKQLWNGGGIYEIWWGGRVRGTDRPQFHGAGSSIRRVSAKHT